MAVVEWELPGVRALAAHQLTPELAEPISRARTVIFADAALSTENEEITAVQVEPFPKAGMQAHTSDPRVLLALAEALYGVCPPAWLIKIPAVSFNLGEPLSAVAERGLAVGLEKVRQLLDSTLSNSRSRPS